MKLQNLFESSSVGFYKFNLGTPGQGSNDTDEEYKNNLPPSIKYEKSGYAAAYTCADYKTLWDFVNKDERTEWRVSKVGSRVFYCASWLNISDFSKMPAIIKADFQCRGNDQMTSLKDVQKYIKQINADGQGEGLFDVSMCDIKSNVLGVFDIKGVKSVYFDHWSEEKLKKVTEIVNKHLEHGDAFSCQDELIDAGLDEYAKV